MRIKLGIACALLLLVAVPSQAEDTTGRFGVGMEAAAMKLVGGEQDYSDLNLNLALNLRYGLSPRLSLQGALKTGWSRPAISVPGAEAGLQWHPAWDIYTTFWQTRLGLLYHLRPQSALAPYVGVALGLSGLRVKDMRGQESFDGLFPGGPIMEGYDTDGKLQQLDVMLVTGTLSAGLDWFLHPRFAFGLGARYHLFPTNDLDNIGLSSESVWGHLPDIEPAEHVDANTGLVEFHLGMTWFFGSTDGDGDGFPDGEDECPEAAEDFDGFQDIDGCPDPDNDGDGIADEADRCPDTAEDEDGFEDEDGCPDPDNDGDGIPDTRDRCPDEAEDMDGFEDEDGCPEVDNDRDGVPDQSDACPGTPAGVAVDARGCPQVAEIKESLVLKGVNFLSGSAELTPESLGVLNDVGRSLLAYPRVRVEIQGHTDSAGAADHNESLSLKRAESVRDYLTSLGVSIRRMRAVGYGERFPVASNGTALGRAENRRVELHRIGN